MSNLAPILLFVYKRLETLKKTVEALKKNPLAKDSELFIFSDAAKSDKDNTVVTSVREYLKTVTGFKTVKIFEVTQNKGLAKSIIDGVSKIINEYEKVIVLEDDLSTTPNFLTYMNTCLKKYETEQKVFSISGYSFNLGINKASDSDAYFLSRGWSWGWATWKDRWDMIDWQVSDFERFKTDRRRKKDFAKGGSDLNAMLEKQMSGKLDSWAIRFFYSQFVHNGLTIYPVFSKVYNNGFDSYATHTTGSATRYEPMVDLQQNQSFNLPEIASITTYYQKRFQKKMGIYSRIVSKIQNLGKNLFGFK